MCPALMSNFAAVQGASAAPIPAVVSARRATRVSRKSEATRRARRLWAVWRRRSRLAIRLKTLSRAAHGYFNTLLVVGLFSLFFPLLAFAEPAPTRAEAVAVAERYATHRWTGSAANSFRGLDRDGVLVETPTCWAPGQENVGVPYKWGGFDSLASFDSGIRAGKAAGDLYTAEKRRKGSAAVSRQSVGIDCSGLISRCWHLRSKRGTATLVEICEQLRSPTQLLPGDIMNAAGGHVLLFARWLDDDKKRALFYEADPFSKVVASELEVASLAAAGFVPLRYREIRD
jgi:hypothetical protein